MQDYFSRTLSEQRKTEGVGVNTETPLRVKPTEIDSRRLIPVMMPKRAHKKKNRIHDSHNRMTQKTFLRPQSHVKVNHSIYFRQYFLACTIFVNMTYRIGKYYRQVTSLTVQLQQRTLHKTEHSIGAVKQHEIWVIFGNLFYFNQEMLIFNFKFLYNYRYYSLHKI